ncbi:MotA_ExbB domain-containing protein [Tenacibaculum sp. 190130A14a]|uniref:MotA_ExbB domain-containing protein n=1 Tax=Tenacibaculum polynesiense TaxID=3137857 RepID=A0ABP1F2E6_9FLAO
MRFLIFGQFFDRLNEGGPVFMYPLFFMMLACIGLIAFSFLRGDEKGVLKKTVHHISLFAIVWGFLGQMIGLIGAFDAISVATGITPQVLAGGLKVALLCPTFGMVVFLIARLGIIGLTLKKGEA